MSLRQSIGDRRGEAYCLSNLSDIALAHNQIAKALDYMEACHSIRQLIDDQRGVADALTNIASLHLLQGHTEQAQDIARQALGIAYDLQNRSLLLGLLYI